MRTETINVYKYQELDSSAQAKARDYFAMNTEYTWFSEAIESIESFCKQFGLKVTDYRIDPEDYRGSYIRTNGEPADFRGYTLKEAKKLLETNGNGYCVYFDCIASFYEEFKESGSAYRAFLAALSAAIRSIEADIEYQYSREAIEEMIVANDYEFTEEGELH